MSLIDLSRMLDRARSFLGQSIGRSADFSDQELTKCLDEVTLPVFSIYLPYYEDVVVDCQKDLAFPDRRGIYLIRRDGLTLIGVNKLRDRNVFQGDLGLPYDPGVYQDILERQRVLDYTSRAAVSMTFAFQAPNLLEVFPKGFDFQNLLVQCKFVHPTTLRTIPPGAYEILKELYLADLARDVLGVREYFSTLQTSFGEINLNLDRLRTQADKRDQLIEKLELKQHKHGLATRVFVG